MLLKSLIQRANGTTVLFGEPSSPSATYLFKPAEANGPHLCEVGDEEHAARLLAQRPRVFALASDPIDAPEPPEEAEPEDFEEIEESDLEDEDEGDDELGPDADITALRAAYRAKYDKNPGPKWDADTIRAKLLED